MSVNHEGLWGVAQEECRLYHAGIASEGTFHKTNTHKFQLKWKPVIFQGLNHAYRKRHP
jgi:hypothetical protein